MEVLNRFFLEYAPHSDFESGLFVPFNAAVEAERQAAQDIASGMDPEFIQQIFEGPYVTSKYGWTRSDLRKDEVSRPLHLDVKNQKRHATSKQILQRSSKHINDIYEEASKAATDELLAVHEAITANRPDYSIKNSVPGNAYGWQTGGTATALPSALVAATAKTVVLILAATANQPSITEIGVSFDGVTTTAVPVLVELVSGTAGAAGTPRAALAAGKQLRGWPAQTSQTTAGDTYTAEPTTQLSNRKWLVSPYGGLWSVQYPLGREPTGIVTAATDGKTWSLRLTAPAAVNCHAYIEWEE